MGIMGALAGLGSGMQDYAATMEKQRQMSWQAQMEQVRFEREEHLQLLRDSNQRQFTAEQNDLNRRHDLAVTERSADIAKQTARDNVKVGELDGMPVYADEVDKINDPKFKKAADVSIENAKNLTSANAEAAMEAEDRLALKHLEDLRKTSLYKNSSEGTREIMEDMIKVNGKFDMKGFNKTKKLEQPTAAMFETVRGELSRLKGWDEMTPATRLVLISRDALKLANPDMPDSGTRSVPEKDWAIVARDLKDGKITAEEFTTLDEKSANGILAELSQIPDTVIRNAPPPPIATRRPGGGALAGTQKVMSSVAAGNVPESSRLTKEDFLKLIPFYSARQRQKRALGQK